MCYVLYVVSCVLYVVCCVLCAACCMLHVACVSCVVCRVSCVGVWCMLYCGILCEGHGIWCMVYMVFRVYVCVLFVHMCMCACV